MIGRVRPSLPGTAVAALAFSLGCSAPTIPPPVTAAAGTGDAQVAAENAANRDPNLNPPFGPYDVQTVFFIEKSNGKDRIDYGMRLDQYCAPVGDGAVFPYWREFEHPPPVRSHPLKFIQYAAYGFSEQRPLEKRKDGGKYRIQLKQVERPIVIVTGKDAASHCTATAFTKIQNVPSARIDHIFVKVSGLMSADYVDVHGADAAGRLLVERLAK